MPNQYEAIGVDFAYNSRVLPLTNNVLGQSLPVLLEMLSDETDEETLLHWCGRFSKDKELSDALRVVAEARKIVRELCKVRLER
jgi:hypothetical protein